jgi:hypothetical protein
MPGKRDPDEMPDDALDDLWGTLDEEVESLSRQDDTNTSRQDDVSAGRQDDMPTSEPESSGGGGESAGTAASEDSRPQGAAQSHLQQHIDLVVDELSGPSAEKPALDAKANGYVSKEVDRVLRQVVSVLQTRYRGQFSKSLILDFAVRVVLMDVKKRGDESELVRWLDRTIERE